MSDQSRAFGIIAQSVIQDEQLSVGARMLYALLASYADATSRECRPLNSTLCDKMRCKPSKLAEWIKELREAGVLQRTERTGTSSITHLTDLLAWPGSQGVHERGGVHDSGRDGSTHVDGGGPHTWTQNSTSRTVPVNKGRSRASAAPAAWPVKDEQSGTDSLSLADWAEQEFGIKNLDWLQRQVDGFLDWARSTDKKYVDWKAAIRNAVRRDVERTGRAPAPTASSDDIDEDEIRIWLKNNLPNRADPLWTRLREAEMDETDEVEPLREEWRQVRRQRAIEALRAER